MASCPQFLSVRNAMPCSHLPPGARTRWVTERIASPSNGSPGKGPESIDEMTGSNSVPSGRRAVASQPKKRQIGNENFFTC